VGIAQWEPAGLRSRDPAPAVIAAGSFIAQGRGGPVGGKAAAIRRASGTAGGGWLVALFALVARAGASASVRV
jgi:hypothetical protein